MIVNSNVISKDPTDSGEEVIVSKIFNIIQDNS